MKNWSKDQLLQHIKINVKDYGSAIIVASLYKKIYGDLPKMGLSGFQAEVAEAMSESLP